MPRIDGALLREAINLFANNKSCAEDNVVPEMLRVLDEDVLYIIAVAIENRVLSRDGEKDRPLAMEDRGSRIVQCPHDEHIDMRDGIVNKKMKGTVHVEDGMVMSFAEEGPEVVYWCKALPCLATTDGPAASARLAPHSVQVPDPVWFCQGFAYR